MSREGTVLLVDMHVFGEFRLVIGVTPIVVSPFVSPGE